MPRKRQQAKRKQWMPVRQVPVNPAFIAALQKIGAWSETLDLQVWSNDIYEVIVRQHPSGLTHLSIKRHDRRAMRDWRHLQALKNEIVGPEREACEIFPAESRIVDSSNEYHLWCLPEGERFPFGYDDKLLMTPGEVAAGRTSGSHRARQRPWQPGLQTGPGSES